MLNKYYQAYNERYLTAHSKGVSWASNERTPIVHETITGFTLKKDCRMLEIGCGEGRDAKAVLDRGYNLLATDISEEAIRYCREKNPEHSEQFCELDCINGKLNDAEGNPRKFDFIYSVAVIHMLVLDSDRAAFYGFIKEHLSENGLALICSMGDGESEMQTDPDEAFTEKERNHESGKMMVAATSCRMVSMEHFRKEIEEAGLEIEETGITQSFPNFNSMLYAIVKSGKSIIIGYL